MLNINDLFWISLLVAFFSLSIIIFSFYKNNSDLMSFSSLFFISAFISCGFSYGSFNEISLNDYDLVKNSKNECLKYESCEKVLKNILEDGIIKEYELKDYRAILDEEKSKEKRIKDLEKKNEKKQSDKEKLEKIKKELKENKE